MKSRERASAASDDARPGASLVAHRAVAICRITAGRRHANPAGRPGLEKRPEVVHIAAHGDRPGRRRDHRAVVDRIAGFGEEQHRLSGGSVDAGRSRAQTRHSRSRAWTCRPPGPSAHPTAASAPAQRHPIAINFMDPPSVLPPVSYRVNARRNDALQASSIGDRGASRVGQQDKREASRCFIHTATACIAVSR